MTRVLVLGGNGYMGRCLLRRSHNEGWDWQIDTFSRDESKMVKVHSIYPDVHTIKGDITSPVEELTRVFYGYDIIIHAAANKLVDIGERTVRQTIKNNVYGSMNVAEAAIRAGVKQVIGISTDKSIQAINTYGSTKFLLERIFQEADGDSDTQFTCARYGNVVGSTISIVLYFQEQLKKTGQIHVTNPEMTRFYMGGDEAVDIILHTLNEAQRGSVVIAKMQAMSVKSVAKLVLGLDEKTPLMLDNRVKIIGERPGEKLHESLLHYQESVRVLPTGQEDVQYYELRPAIEPPSRKEPFAITSNNPPRGWMTPERMKFLIEDATGV